jgi:hypothetical protein
MLRRGSTLHEVQNWVHFRIFHYHHDCYHCLMVPEFFCLLLRKSLESGGSAVHQMAEAMCDSASQALLPHCLHLLGLKATAYSGVGRNLQNLHIAIKKSTVFWAVLLCTLARESHVLEEHVAFEECRLLGYKKPVRTSQETHYVSATESSQLMLCKIWCFQGGN